MWTCNNCLTEVEDTMNVCPKCGTAKEETPIDVPQVSTPEMKPEQTSSNEPISSGVDNWAIAHIVFAVIFFIAALCFWAAGADSYSKKTIYYEDAMMYAGMGVASLFMSSVIKGFGFIIKAAKLYLKNNGVKID